MESVKIDGADAQALRANKLMLAERLADDLAHEIKNPLHSMVINLEVLKRRVSRWSGADATELMRYVGILSGELDRVSNRIDLLLRMVRPDRGGEPISLAEAVEDLLEVVELERERLGITVEIAARAETSHARIPPDLARQISLNLLLMAIDAAAPGGTVRISSWGDAEEEHLRLQVEHGPHADRRKPDGVEDETPMSAAVRALADAFGGRLQIGPGAEGDAPGTEILISFPTASL